MADYFAGLCMAVLGFGVYQFSHLFGLYSAQDKRGIPWPYRILQVISYSLMGIGVVVLIIGLM
ncbi:MAG TPA: hypothetical protein VJ873_02210 [bacterium]|nr:hypothetical protein [bacterium]